MHLAQEVWQEESGSEEGHGYGQLSEGGQLHVYALQIEGTGIISYSRPGAFDPRALWPFQNRYVWPKGTVAPKGQMRPVWNEQQYPARGLDCSSQMQPQLTGLYGSPECNGGPARGTPARKTPAFYGIPEWYTVVSADGTFEKTMFWYLIQTYVVYTWALIFLANILCVHVRKSDEMYASPTWCTHAKKKKEKKTRTKVNV